MYKKTFIWIFICVFVLITQLLIAQRTVIYSDNYIYYKTALDFFDEEKYSISQYFFEKYKNSDNRINLLESDAAYYIALCGIELFNKDSEKNLVDYLSQYQENSRTQYAQYKMGIFKYREKKFKKAIPWFEKVNPDYLSKDEKAEYYFKLGYSYFVNNEYDKAEKAFYEIKDIPNIYYSPALYFYSHIAYTKKNYETALKGFEKLKNDETFASIVPYYISQIYFIQEKYDDVINYATQFLVSANIRRKVELARIIGESYYKTNRFKEAIPYLEQYAKAVPLTRADMYELSYAYYKTGYIPKAARLLEKITIQDDTLSQQSLYLLAYCYLYDGLKNNARMALEKAYKMPFVPEIQEETMLHYAKLCFELSYTPFNEAVKAFQEFIAKYPNSPRIDEAYADLSKAFLYSKNYKEAIDALENIKHITPEIEEAYQRACFYRGLELFNNLDFEQAIIHFDKSLNNAKYNKIYAAQAIFWKAEAYYRLKDINNALAQYKKFLITAGAFETDLFAIAHYNIAYCYFEQHDYNEAQLWFRKYLENESNKDIAQVYDAYTRIGDCFFVLRRYEDAIEYYSKAIVAKKASPDYALFQQAICFGLLKQYNDKIIALNELLNNYPSSPYIDDAIFELGVTYANIDENEMGINTLYRIINEYPHSDFVKKAYLQMGLIYFNINKNDEAITAYKKVIESYPNTQEYKDAFVGLKNVYLEMNDINSYYAYVNEKGKGISISETEKDSLTYTVAEKVYMNGDCNKSITLLTDYISKFPHGIYTINAHYYLAECLLKNNDIDNAYTHYLAVVEAPKSVFTEPSLLKVANYQFNKKHYPEAIPYYSQLLEIAQFPKNAFAAKTGLMRCYFQLSKYDDANRYAIDLLKEGKISDELYREAHFIIGKAAYMQNKLEQALDEFELIAKSCKSEEEAEAKYLIIDIYYKQNKFDLAEQQVYDFVKKNTPHQYWLAKSFLILADIYVAKNNDFQAKATLQSILDNYENKDDGIITEATNRVQSLLDKEKEAIMLEEPSNPENNEQNPTENE